MAIRKFGNSSNRERKGIVGVTYGVFDLCHPGHHYFLNKCSENCNYLIVCLESDPSIERPYKNKPIQSVEERRIVLQNIRSVDEVVEFDSQQDLYTYLKSNVDNISIRFSESYWQGKKYVGHELAIPVMFIDRIGTYSTSEIRARVSSIKKTP